MSDEIVSGSLDAGPEEGQPSDAVETQPTYVTREELQAAIIQAVNDAKRYSQSMVDKSSDRVTKALKEQEKALLDRVDTLRKAGYDVTDDVVAEQRKQIVQRVLAGESDVEEIDDDEPAQAAPPTDYRLQARAFAAQGRVADAIAEAGFAVERNDPELRSILSNAPTPEEWERSYLTALQRKATRLGKPFQPAQVTGSNAPAAARVPGGSGGAGSSPASLEQNTKRLEELYRDPLKNQKEINRLLAENEKLLRHR